MRILMHNNSLCYTIINDIVVDRDRVEWCSITEFSTHDYWAYGESEGERSVTDTTRSVY